MISENPPAWIFRANPPSFEPAEDAQRARYLVPRFPVGSLRQPPRAFRGRKFEPAEYLALDRRVYVGERYGATVLYVAAEEESALHDALNFAVFALDFLAFATDGIRSGIQEKT